MNAQDRLRSVITPVWVFLVTSSLIICTTAVWLVWDALVFIVWGGDATESSTIGSWLARPYFGRAIAFLLGGLPVHFVLMCYSYGVQPVVIAKTLLWMAIGGIVLGVATWLRISP